MLRQGRPKKPKKKQECQNEIMRKERTKQSRTPSKHVGHKIDTLNEHAPNELNQNTTPRRPKDGDINHI